MTRKTETFDYGNIPITKLPPGKAFGADDLTKWAHRRTLGWSGTGAVKTRALKLHCRFCGADSEKIGQRRFGGKSKRAVFDCANCGKKGAHIVRSKVIKE